MAHAGYIIIKGDDKAKAKDYRSFYGPQDKGSAKPSFCYPQQKKALEEDIKGMERSLKDGYVAETRVLKVKQELRTKKERLDAINQQESDAKKLFKENKDACMQRRNDLAETISAAMPTANDVAKRRVNPHRIAEMEKNKGLGKMKTEFQILSHLAEEESNTRFLQRD